MNGKLRLRFEWPGLAAEALADVLGNSDGISESDDGLYWTLVLGVEDSVLEVPARQAELPLACGTDAIYLRELTDLRHLVALPPNGGVQNLLRAPDACAVLAVLDARLARFRERLAREGRVYVFAAHRNAVKCVRYCQQLGIELVAFVDNDTAKQGSEFYGRPVLPLAAVPRDAVIINASGRYCVQINEQLRQQRYPWGIDLMEFLFLYDLPFQAEDRFRAYVSEIVEHRLGVVSLYILLADERSRVVLDGLTLFRLSLDSSIAGRQASPYAQEFFAEDVLHFGPNEVFVDGGAFDGDSFRRFVAMAPGFRKAYLFEPDGEICRRAEKTLGSDPRVAICNYGLWSSMRELRFSSTGGMDGAICEEGEIRVPVVSIDDFISDTVTHIKLDVEGAEEEALRGASRTIGGSRPRMAIALYHRAADLWCLPAQIEALGGRYAYSIRHYSQTVDDTIVYALPIS